MWDRLAGIYARRIVNVNVNIIAAGVLALIPVLLVVHLVEWALARGLMKNQRLHLSDQLIIGAATFIADVTFDVAIYYGLHWLANHAPWMQKKRLEQIDAIAEAAVQETPFFRDATKVQLQRAVISPLLYVLWLVTQHAMMQLDFSAVVATVTGFVVAMVVARSIHTIWMLKEEQRAKKKASSLLCRACGFDLKPMPIDAPERCPSCGKAFDLVRRTPDDMIGAVASNGPATPPGSAQSLSENGVKSVSRSK